MSRRVLLLTGFAGQPLERLIRAFEPEAAVELIADLPSLLAARIDDETSLISFGSGVIVPRGLLSHLRKPAYNLHAASPDFPGRDPHHHAVYRGAALYGATLHVMTAEVDAGPIVAVERFPVTDAMPPAELLARANEVGLLMLERLAPRLLETTPLQPVQDEAWGPIKTRRADLQRLCALTPLIGEEEFARRYRAFEGGAYANLSVTLHGHAFRIEKVVPPPSPAAAGWEEFTEHGFRELLRAAKARDYRFIRYGEPAAEAQVLWRHDVDFSMHRAARLAEIEAEEGAVATYFLNPRCVFYNLLEPEIARLVARIRALGHDLGLHFDASAYGVTHWTQDELERALLRERTLLEAIVEIPVASVSWHNPDLSNLLDLDAESIGGLVNAYSARLRDDYAYCSDSNGYWRFRRMADVIAARHPRLHLLTHPEWWTPVAMAPTARLDRAILGRAQAARAYHDGLVARSGRKDGRG